MCVLNEVYCGDCWKVNPFLIFPPQCCDKIRRNPFPCTEMFLITLYLQWKGIRSLFCNCYCVHTHTHTHTHTHMCTHCIFRPKIHTCAHAHTHKHNSFVQTVFPVSVWVSQTVQFPVPGEFWMEGNFSNQTVFSDWRSGNWGRVWKEGKAKREL
jgi:hypothetical protein